MDARPNSTTCQALEAFAISAALAIEHAALRERAEESERRYRDLASHDPLTGVGNRTMLLQRLEHAETRRPEDDALFSVVFVDLDKFKIINDHHSHDAGDHVLQVVARRIQASVRPHDTVVRWGGDEFLILLEQLKDKASALAVAERITAAVAQTIRRDGHDLSAAASVGVTLTQVGEQVGVNELIQPRRHSDVHGQTRGRKRLRHVPTSTAQNRARLKAGSDAGKAVRLCYARLG